ncbi:hypothetical protein Pla100_60480 [Neorhodopirellula pilleata]|uniref:Uncharacterized protein n=1 Tax=Neorhodopirellula pilleata TaxID=2714738 RepID=A0A5C5ZIQ8_9BACT|nr:hypothetical protein Pla100_60480 [Neorhodopirellula pilleata]
MADVSVLSRIAVGETLKNDAIVALLSVPGTLLEPVPVTTTESTAAVTLSLRSRSVTVNVPLSVRPALVSVNEDVSGPPVITGASLVPLTVMTTSCVSVFPWLSSTSMVYVSVSDSPVAR